MEERRDLISRRMAIDIERNATVDTNPSHFEAHQKFTQFMDDAEVSSFGRWQWSNGFNTALTAVEIDLKKLPSVQPEILACGEGELNVPDTNVGDMISRQAAIDALDKRFDDVPMELSAEILKLRRDLRALPPSAPSTAQTTETTETTETIAPSTDDWIPVEKRLPAVPWCRCLITRDDGRGRTTVEEALFSFGRWYGNEWLEDGRNRKFDISTSVIAWAPFPAPYRGGDE